jgi:hypothetical protein
VKPPREVIGEELLRQVIPDAIPTEEWFESADAVIAALEEAGYIIVLRTRH